MTKQQFKKLVKEALVEIISEGGLELQPKPYHVKFNNGNNPTTQSTQQRSHNNAGRVNESQQRRPMQQQAKPKPITGDAYLDSLIMSAKDQDPYSSGGVPMNEGTMPNMNMGNNPQDTGNVYKMDHIDYGKFSDIFDDDKKFKKAKTNANTERIKI